MAIYCIDTSSVIEAWNRLYPIEVFPGVWHALDQLISSRQLFASELVLEELGKKSDGASSWAKQRPQMFLDVDTSQQALVREILRRYPKLVDERPGRNQADPFVIALAKHHGAICVTEEGPGTDRKVRIPYVCDGMNVLHTRLVGMLQNEQFLFTLDPGSRL